MTIGNATAVFADINQSVLLQYRAEVKNITLSGISYSIQLDKYVGRSEGASFIYSGEKTGMLKEKDSYTFSNGLQLTVTKLTRSGFDSTGIIYIQLDDANVTSEQDDLSVLASENLTSSLSEFHEAIFTLSGKDYDLQVDFIGIEPDNYVRFFEHNNEISGLLRLNESFVFSDGLRITLDDITYNAFSSMYTAYFTVDDELKGEYSERSNIGRIKSYLEQNYIHGNQTYDSDTDELTYVVNGRTFTYKIKDNGGKMFSMFNRSYEISLGTVTTNTSTFIHDNERSYVLNIGEYYVFSDGLKISLNQIEGSVQENYRRVYLTIEESDEKPTQKKGILRKLVDWLVRLFK